jgi:hypothetical protein
MIKFDTSMGEKAIWDAANVKLFCDLCTKEVNAGHRPLGHLNKVGWKNVEVKFVEVTGKKLEHLQMKNKWDSLKRSYTSPFFQSCPICSSFANVLVSSLSLLQI